MNGLTVKHQEDYYRQDNLLTHQKKQLDKFIRNLHYYDIEHILAVVNEQEFAFKYRIKDEKKLKELNQKFEEIQSMLPNFLKRMTRSSESMTVPCCTFYDGEGYYETLPDEQKYDFIKLTFKGVFEIYMLQRFMIMTRNAFGPRSGKGSQSNNFDMYIEMYDFFKKIAEKENERFDFQNNTRRMDTNSVNICKSYPNGLIIRNINTNYTRHTNSCYLLLSQKFQKPFNRHIHSISLVAAYDVDWPNISRG